MTKWPELLTARHRASLDLTMAGKFRITYNAPVVLTFSLLALVIHVVTDWIYPELTVKYFAARPDLREPLDYFTMVSHILGHANWQHLVGNFMIILLLGPILEERHGSGSLLIMIGLTALVTGIINAVFLSTGLLGASGILFMMILLASMANVRSREIPLTFILVALLYLGGEALAAFRDDKVSQMAHLVGGLAGAVFGFIAARATPGSADKTIAKTVGLPGARNAGRVEP